MGRNCGKGGAILSTKSKRKANGCMGAFYHLFDFQHVYFPSHHNLTIDSPSRLKGLKLIEESPPSRAYKDKQSLNIPVSMRVRTETAGTRSSRLKALATDTSSEICNSPGSKTPSLVARLMGLDLLPEKTDLNHSLPSLLHTMTHHGTSRLTSHPKRGTSLGGGTRSLPESPRVSSARKSDFDIHRLSLQLNKENNRREEFGCSRLKLMKQQQDQEEIQSPRQIVKQIKERVVTRRVFGMDITNSVKNREARPLQDSNELRRDATVSCSPRTRFSNKENKPSTSSSFRPQQTPTKVILVSVSKASGEKQSKNRVKQIQKEVRPINQCKKKEKSETRFTQRPLKPSQTPESTTDTKASNPFYIKKIKKVPKSSDVANNISVTKPPQNQVTRVPSPHINEREGLKANETEENGPEATRTYHCSVVASYISKRCPILGEIASVDFDHRLLETKKLEEEVEELIAQIERDIIEALVRETANELILQRRRSQTTSGRKLNH